MGIIIKKSGKRITSTEIKRNINHFSWICTLFVLMLGIFIAWRFFKTQNYSLIFFSFLASIFVAIFVKRIVFNYWIKKARKKHKKFLKDLLTVKLNRKRFFTISGITLLSSVVFLEFFIVFTMLLIPNIEIVQAEQIVFGAHRGNSVDFIENTIPAFEDAVEQEKYKFIEFDVQYTKDKKMVVFHDDNLFRLQKKLYSIKKLTYDELLNVSDYYVPLYSEVMDLITPKKPVSIEIKSQGNFSDDKIITDYIIEDCKRRGVFNTTLFISISSDIVEYISKKYPDAETGKVYYVVSSSFLNFDVFTSGIFEEMERIGADYIMLHANNLKNYNSLRNIKSKDQTIVFWYLTNDQIYVINPKEESWLTGRIIKKFVSPEVLCLWWCD